MQPADLFRTRRLGIGPPAPNGLEGSDTLAVVRRILASDSAAEQRLEELLAERRHEIEEQAARLSETVQDLERREQLLRDSRASLERLLRLGTTDLDSREAELVRLVREVTAREERVRAHEAELARRREELGAVELKRAALERREQALDERAAALDAREAEVAASGGDDGRRESAPELHLAFVPGAGYRLRELDPVRVDAGATLSLDGDEYVVSRIGPSPLPADPRRCAYLVRGPRGGSPDGSS
jgi:hypothetical protein